jgi:translation elongation factor EF-4
MGDRIRLMSNGAEYLAEEIGYLTPKPVKVGPWKQAMVVFILLPDKKSGSCPDWGDYTLVSQPDSEAFPL